MTIYLFPLYIQVAKRIRTVVQDCGNACVELVKSGGMVQCNPTDNLAKKDLIDNARTVTEKVGQLNMIGFAP